MVFNKAINAKKSSQTMYLDTEVEEEPEDIHI